MTQIPNQETVNGYKQTTVVSNRYKIATKTQHDQKETLNDYRHKKETK